MLQECRKMIRRACWALALSAFLTSQAYAETTDCAIAQRVTRGQTYTAQCDGYVVPDARADELLTKERQVDAARERARIAEAQVVGLEDEKRDLQRKLDKRKGKFWKGVTVGMVIQGAIVIAILAL